MKIVCMIPARLGSTRVKNKNLRMINKKPLIQYIIDSAKKTKYLKDIYINSEAPIFKTIADENNVKFYQRNESLSTDKATNDDFTLDFLNNVECDILIQLLPTSPFITENEIDDFVGKMLSGGFETMVSVTDVQIESVYNGVPINFDQRKKTPPSQDLEPIKAYACGLMGWKSSSFKENIKRDGAAYHGGSGKIGFFELLGFSKIDIDNEEDFILAEAVAESLQRPKKVASYFQSGKDKLIFDANREAILVDDGVQNNLMFDYNKEQISIEKIINSNPSTESWSHTVINSPSNSAALIAQMPGEGNRMHYHHDWDEWWYIVDGEWEWLVDGKPQTVKKGAIVFIERNRVHKITAKGNKMAIRLAVSRHDVDHVYTQSDYVNE